MAIAKITLIGMYNYLDSQHRDLFQLLRLPTDIDKETAINYILMSCGEMPVLWANPDFVQRMIGIWANKMYDNFAREAHALKIEYDPIYNYDKYEDWDTHQEGEGSKRTEGNNTTTGQTSAYDSSTFQNNDKSITDAEADSTNEQQMDETRRGHSYGNTGWMSRQNLIERELELRTTYNIYEIVANAFKKEFCVMVY